MEAKQPVQPQLMTPDTVTPITTGAVIKMNKGRLTEQHVESVGRVAGLAAQIVNSSDWVRPEIRTFAATFRREANAVISSGRWIA